MGRGNFFLEAEEGYSHGEERRKKSKARRKKGEGKRKKKIFAF